MIGFVIASVGVLLRDIERIITKNVVWAFIIMHIAVWLSVLMWFMEAPFIRYGLCFILAMPCILIGEYLSMRKRGLGHVIRAIYIITTFMFCLEFINNYFEDFGVFVKQNITDSNYIVQKDYDSTPTNSQKVGDFELNYPIDGELNSYYAYPGTAYQGRLDEIEARGDTIRDGFRHKTS